MSGKNEELIMALVIFSSVSFLGGFVLHYKVFPGGEKCLVSEAKAKEMILANPQLRDQEFQICVKINSVK